MALHLAGKGQAAHNQHSRTTKQTANTAKVDWLTPGTPPLQNALQ